MSALQIAITKMDGQAALAAAIGVKQQNVWNWLNRGDKVPPEYCVAIEQATVSVVMRWDLRPDDWHLIWPELIERKGAPDVPSPTSEPTQEAAR